ncbi:glycosyltransferase family 4 protein [Thiohalomonas denitrificans]|uniref:Glycosyltransferase involved in cell wall bisynthesis n=1 Tax=Thiohalomonas denitrificans TaxID=415747 RepID=A0A1G5QIY4_9GAMM|nr:glycosyltransferase family 4 protein [Thiohalomonas denitrificans]SCZ61510.1 Glycosyltransferase involved in cell wall bisynthesis [Thiohalomonas denitrificans]
MQHDFKICHLTSVHARYDTRIFIKEAQSLARAGYCVALVVADGKGDVTKNGVLVYDVGLPQGRRDRFTLTTRKMLKKAKEIDADVYHLHDPELLPAGLKLKRMGKKVIFDSHEDVPMQIRGKSYLNRPARWLFSNAFRRYEAWVCRQLDAVVAATPFIRDKFLAINANSVDINNFPILGELAEDEVNWSLKQHQICYVGDITASRGIKEMVRAVGHVKSGARLQLGGRFSDRQTELEVKSYAGWEGVDQLGWLNRDQIRQVLARSMAGLVTLHSTINYVDALPVKMFEYMSAGLPVIASRFPLWQEIIEGNQCGICVDPSSSQQIAAAIDSLIDDPEWARQMGDNGQRAVRDHYNWPNEEKKLLGLYGGLFGG